MTDTLKAWLLIVLFVVVIIAPVLLLLLSPQAEGREFWRELSVALGFAGLSLIGFQFIPTARLRFLGEIFPMDTLYAFHHKISIAGFIFALAHPLILFVGNPYTIELLNLISAPWRARAGVVAVILFILLIITTIWRLELKIKYERWRTIHDIFAVAAAALVLVHMFLVNNYMANPLQRGYWYVSAGVWLIATLYIRVYRPIELLRKPYRVAFVEPRRGSVWSLILEPDGHPGLEFKPGQFAWLTARTSPFSFRDNPFSFSSSSEHKKDIHFTIQEAGDFTAMVDEFKPGEKVYVDGPFGTFGIDWCGESAGYVMIAGGIGSVPFLSMIRTMYDRKDDCPIYFFYGNKDWETVVYREELEYEAERMALEVIHVLEEPPEGWEGETGFITAEIMERYLPEDRNGMKYMICGPLPMIAAIEKELEKMNVPLHQIFTENYEMA